MKLIDNVDKDLFVTPDYIEGEIRPLLRAGVLKADVARALESALVIVDAYKNAEESEE